MPHDETMKLLVQVEHDFFGRVWRRAQALPVHPRQGPMLSMLLHEEGLTQSDVVRRFDISPATVAVSVSRLEKLGLLRRAPSAEDGRMQRLSLTDAGREAARELEDILRQVEAEAFADFAPEEKDALHGYLGRMQAGLQSDQPKEPKR